MTINEDIQFSTGQPIPYEVYVTNDKDFIRKHVDEILTLINASYKDKGGNSSANTIDKIMQHASIAKLVFNDARQIIALALYRDNIGGHKRFCSASNRSDLHYKDAVKAIIQNDIEPYDNWYWAEVSDKIELFFKKLNGNPIPNYLAHKFLRKPKKDIILLDDGVHYKRYINLSDSESTTKAIYGFKSEDAMNLVMSKIDNYEQFKIDANSVVDELFEDDEDATEDERSLEAASIVIQELNEFHDNGFNEMLPSWKKQLLHAIARFLSEQKKKHISLSKKTYVQSNLDTAKYLIKHMPVLEFYQLKIS